MAGAALLVASASQPASASSETSPAAETDPVFPGTSVQRLRAVTKRVLSLSQTELDGPWPEVRRRLLWAGGLRDIPATAHAFNDYNHCDLTTMYVSIHSFLHTQHTCSFSLALLFALSRSVLEYQPIV